MPNTLCNIHKPWRVVHAGHHPRSDYCNVHCYYTFGERHYMSNVYDIVVLGVLDHLKRSIDENHQPTKRGICSYVYDELMRQNPLEQDKFAVLESLRQLKVNMARWPEGTSDMVYPVPTGSGSILAGDISAAYRNTDLRSFWLIGPYAKKRYDLICYLIIIYKEKYDEYVR